MRVAALLACCLVLLGLACAANRLLGLAVARVDVAVVVVAFLALRAGTIEGALGAFAAGFFVDALSGQPSFLYVFTAVASFLAARTAFPRLEGESALSFALAAGALDLFHNVVAWLLVLLTSPEGVSRSRMLAALPAAAGLTAAAALLCWPLLDAVDARARKPEKGLGS
jgi:hypothetical protein